MDKLEMLKKFEQKQKVVGEIFSFIVGKNNEIIISYYYENLKNNVVVIPDFVDIIYGRLFRSTTSENIQKVICNSNLTGYIDFTFAEMNVDSLDLSEFDTRNIISMKSLFANTKANIIKLSGKFGFEKVTDMSNMFAGCNINELYITNEFNAEHINTEGMFKGSKIGKIHLEPNFLRKPENIKIMDSLSDETEIIICGDKEIENGKIVSTGNDIPEDWSKYYEGWGFGV